MGRSLLRSKFQSPSIVCFSELSSANLSPKCLENLCYCETAHLFLELLPIFQLQSVPNHIQICGNIPTQKGNSQLSLYPHHTTQKMQRRKQCCFREISDSCTDLLRTSPLRCYNVQNGKYRVIYKSAQDFRPLRYSSRDGHAEGDHVNRGRDTQRFCPTLRVLDMSTLGDAADVNPVIKSLPHTLYVCGRNLITGLTSY